MVLICRIVRCRFLHNLEKSVYPTRDDFFRREHHETNAASSAGASVHAPGRARGRAGDALPHRLLLPRDGFSRGHALGPERHLHHVRARGRRGDGLPR